MEKKGLNRKEKRQRLDELRRKVEELKPLSAIKEIPEGLDCENLNLCKTEVTEIPEEVVAKISKETRHNYALPWAVFFNEGETGVDLREANIYGVDLRDVDFSPDGSEVAVKISKEIKRGTK